MKTAEEIIKEKGGKIISTGPDSTVHDALQVMLRHQIGAILVKDGEQFVGIWTERDLMSDVLKPEFDPARELIKDHMTTGLRSAHHNESAFELFDKFLGIRLRHLLIEKDGEYIGLVSTGDVIRTCLVERTAELQELNALVSWEYYENWRWHGEESCRKPSG
jgi:signal-transduction protein with cAMP-binding, CBS, and nucleotidyltransferase domain